MEPSGVNLLESASAAPNYGDPEPLLEVMSDNMV